MEATAILTEAKTNPNFPNNWVVLTLKRNKVIWGITGWIFGVIVGLGLFIGVAATTIPTNFERGPVPIVLTTLILAMFLFIGVGSLWCLITDVRRLIQAQNHIIVLTPDDFVMQEGDRITHVPLLYVRDILVRSTPAYSRKIEAVGPPSASDHVARFFVGRRRQRTPTLLAFIDSRNKKQIKVLRDESYGDPTAIGDILDDYASKVQDIVL